MAKKDTREQIIKAGLRMLRKYSYNSFSFGDIAKEIGIKKASIHYYFPTKEVLGVALVQYYADKIKYYISQIEYDLTPIEQMQKFVDFFKVGLEKKYLCPAGVLSIEFFTLPQEMQDELKILHNFYLAWLTKVCEEGRSRGEFDFEGDAESMAFHISTSIQGATAIARAYNEEDHYNRSLNIILRQLVVPSASLS